MPLGHEYTNVKFPSLVCVRIYSLVVASAPTDSCFRQHMLVFTYGISIFACSVKEGARGLQAGLAKLQTC